MFLNLLLTDPDNVPDGYGGLDMQAVYAFYMALLGIIVTVIAACLIGYLYNKAYPNGKKQTVTTILVIATIIICVVFISLMLTIDGMQ